MLKKEVRLTEIEVRKKQKELFKERKGEVRK